MNKSLISLLDAMKNGIESEPNFALDIGGHYGKYAQFLIGTGAFSKVISFEPNPESYLKLLENITQSGTCNFEAVNCAISNESGYLNLYSDQDSATASLFEYDNSYVNQGGVASHTVSVTSIDQFLDVNKQSGRLIFLKADTQGNDLNVIKGAETNILLHRPVIQLELIFTDMYKGQCSPSEIQKELSNLGYELYSLNNLHINKQGRLAFCDALFIPMELSVPSVQEYECIDNNESLQEQIKILHDVCEERLSLIKILDSEIKHLKNESYSSFSLLKDIIKKAKSWGR